jgi:hypothetical protein
VAALVHDRHLSAATMDVPTYVQDVMTSFWVRDYQGPSNAGRRPDPLIIRNGRGEKLLQVLHLELSRVVVSSSARMTECERSATR